MAASDSTLNISKIVVLGHSGFIGRNLSRHFQANYPNLPVIGLSSSELDLATSTAASDLQSFLDERSVVILCSAIPKWNKDSVDSYISNLYIVANVIRAVQTRPIRQLVYFSSAAVYGEGFDRIGITEQSEPTPTTFYGFSKLAAEQLLKHAFQLIPVSRLLILRPSLVYGTDNDPSHYLPLKFASDILSNHEIHIWGDGAERRNFIFINDVSVIINKMITENIEGLFNLISDDNLSYRDMISKIEKVSDRTAKFIEKQRTRPKVDIVFGPSPVKQFLGGINFTSPEDAVNAILRALPLKS